MSSTNHQKYTKLSQNSFQLFLPPMLDQRENASTLQPQQCKLLVYVRSFSCYILYFILASLMLKLIFIYIIYFFDVGSTFINFIFVCWYLPLQTDCIVIDGIIIDQIFLHPSTIFSKMILLTWTIYCLKCNVFFLNMLQLVLSCFTPQQLTNACLCGILKLLNCIENSYWCQSVNKSGVAIFISF